MKKRSKKRSPSERIISEKTKDFAKQYESMKYDVQGGQEIGNSSQGRSLKKMCQYGHARTEKKT